MAKQSSPAKPDPTMDAIYDPATYAGHEVTGDWRQGFSVILNGIPIRFSRSLGVDNDIQFEVWAEIVDGAAKRDVMLMKTRYDSRASVLFQAFADRQFEARNQQRDNDICKAIDAIKWAAEGNRGG